MGCYIWYSEKGTGWGLSPPRLLVAVPNVTAHPSTASVSITVLLYNGPLFCGFNVAIIGLSLRHKAGLYAMALSFYMVIMQIRSFVCMSPTRLAVSGRSAARATRTTGVQDVSSVVRKFTPPVKFILTRGSYKRVKLVLSLQEDKHESVCRATNQGC